jgi:hypothetical protein
MWIQGLYAVAQAVEFVAISRDIQKSSGLFRTYTLVNESQLDQYSGYEIVPNQRIEIAQEFTSQWNLDRIDQVVGLNGVYYPAPEFGSNVDLYVIDTGVQATHASFTGRVLPGFDAITSGGTGDTDCHSHGTHVASTAAGEGLGIAREATIIPVRILECDGRGSLFSFAQGVQWVVKQLRVRKRNAVVNLSIQSTASDVMDELIRDLYHAGAVVVVAAANFNSNACNYSPAREPLAVTVGATSEDDSKLGSSNFGPCVDLYAPGDQVVGASPFSGGTSVKRGTSMASPLVAGVALTIFERFPRFNNQAVIQHLLKLATRLGQATTDVDCSGSLIGQLLLQTMDPHPTQEIKTSTLKWTGEMYTCVTFRVRVLATRDKDAPLQLVLATRPFHTLEEYTDTSPQCRANVDWTRVDTYDDETRLTKVWNRFTLTHDQPRTFFLTREFIQVYVSSTQFGFGDGSVEEPVVEYTAPMKWFLGFGTSSKYELDVSGIRACSNTTATTPPPAEVFTVTRASRYMFTRSWSRCRIFTVRFARTTKVLVRLDRKRVVTLTRGVMMSRFKQPFPIGVDVTFRVGGTSLDVYIQDTWMSYTSLPSFKSISVTSNMARVFRVTTCEDGNMFQTIG